MTVFRRVRVSLGPAFLAVPAGTIDHCVDRCSSSRAAIPHHGGSPPPPVCLGRCFAPMAWYDRFAAMTTLVDKLVPDKLWCSRQLAVRWDRGSDRGWTRVATSPQPGRDDS